MAGHRLPRPEAQSLCGLSANLCASWTLIPPQLAQARELVLGTCVWA